MSRDLYEQMAWVISDLEDGDELSIRIFRDGNRGIVTAVGIGPRPEVRKPIDYCLYDSRSVDFACFVMLCHDATQYRRHSSDDQQDSGTTDTANATGDAVN